MSNYVIETNSLTKEFAGKCVVDSVNLKVRPGSVTALLGRNGAGKSTLIRMIMGFLVPTRGTSTILGRSSFELDGPTRGRIGMES